jgi:hypothetical protein
MGHYPLSTITHSQINLFSQALPSRNALIREKRVLAELSEDGAKVHDERQHVSDMHETSARTLTEVLMRYCHCSLRMTVSRVDTF